MANRTLAERFWAKVDKRGDNECWPWLACSNRDGYGSIGDRPGHMMLAHRCAWQLVNGPIPRGDGALGTVVMHACDNRACCNPSHLRLGSQAQNIADCKGKQRIRKGSAHQSAKLDETDVKLMRFLRRIGARNRDIAEWFGMSKQATSLVGNGTYWRHVA